MKKIIYTAALILACSTWFEAQEVVAYTRIGNSAIVQQDSIVAFINVADPMAVTHFQDSVLITSNAVLLFLQPMEDTSTLLPSIAPIEGLQVYPNPTFGSLILQKEDIPYSLEIEVFDTKGILVKTYEWPAYLNSTQTNLSDFTQGTYYIRVSNHEKTAGNTYKILKQ